MTKGEVMDLTVVCQSFPELPEPLISRENFLDTIDRIFESSGELTVTEGEEGIGKTILLAQFAKRHPDHALSLFIRPTSRWGYDPEILRFDLCNQIQWAVCQEELSSIENANDTFLRNSLTKLQRRTRYGDKFFFVIDGLDQVPEESSYVRELVLDMVPMGLPGFRFLLSGDLDQLSEHIPQGVRRKPYPLSGFTPGQVIQYFEGLKIDRQSLKEINETCRGIPGHLETVKRILKTGISVQTLLEEWPDKKLFEIEWSRVQSDNNKQLTLLAILAHDRKRHSVNELAHIMDLEPAAIQELLQNLGFVSTIPGGEISFVSEAFRGFAAKQLWHLREEVNELLIAYLLRDPKSEGARRYLPGYLERAERFEDILNYLSSDHFPEILQFSQSLGPVKKQAQLGLDTARKLRRDGDLVRFSVQKSAMTEIGRTNVWHSEIEARMALGDYESAIALAQSSILKEERFHLLAIIAKAKCKQGLSPAPELKDQIRQLYNQIDYTVLDDERVVEIAGELVYSEPELAIEMVEKTTNTNVDENALDWAFAKLAITASSATNEQYQSVDTAQNIRSRIQDPELRSFSAAVSLLVGEYPATEVVAWVKKNLDSADKRLYLLRQWAMDNREREDAAEVVRFALDLAIQSTPYSPNAGVFREIAAPLPFITDLATVKELVDRFDAQQGTVERYGPTEDYVRLQLLLARTESRYDFDAASNRFVDVYQYVVNLDDLAVKTGCMARIVAGLAEMDPTLRLETEANIHTLAQNKLISNTERLLDATAEHYYAARSVIRALAKAKPDKALDLAMRLNTEARRDLALLELVRSAGQAHVDKLNLACIKEVIESFADTDLRDEALLEVLKRLAFISDKHDCLTKAALPLINCIEHIQDAGERCKACCLAHSFLMAQNPDQYSGLLSHLLHLLESAWDAIDVEWHKVDIGFRIARSLAETSLETAQTYSQATERWKEEVLLDTQSAALTYSNCIRLAIRAYGGLLPTHLDSPEDMERLAQLVRRVPSSGERAELWAELALRCHINRRLDECERVVIEYVKPSLRGIPDEDKRYRAEVIATVAPALYCAHRQTSLECVSELPRHYEDAAYAQICEFFMRHRLPSEPYDAVAGQAYDVTYEEIVDICELLKLMDHDGLIYHFIERIANSFAGHHKKDFTRQQRADIINRLEGIISGRLPRKRHIQHDGYKIAGRAQIARIQRPGSEGWLNLIESAREIPNLADRALVLCMVAIAMPTKERDRQKAVLEEAQNLIEGIPATLDRIQRYEEFASMVLDIDVARAKDCLNSAMNFARADKPELYSHQRRIINLAYMIDDKFAESLASLSDDDPARIETRTNLEWQLQVLDLRSKMAKQLASGEDLTASSQSNLSKSAWMMLGMLNAGRVTPSPLDYTRDFVQAAADLPFNQSYPVLAWVIENAKQRLASAQTRRRLRPMYEAILLGSELAAKLAARSSAQLERVKCQMIKSSEDGSVLIRAGEREKALKVLRDWFEHEVQAYLKICDPFFGPDDLKVLQLLRSVNPTCQVQILTSKQHHDQEVQKPWEETYRNHWRFKISSSQNPPDTEVVIVGIKSSNKSPIHDRWWLTDGKGIRIGTSFNSLGFDRESEISHLTEEEARVREAEVNQYLTRNTREHNGERLEYTLFTL
jgi:hypothetical protein